MDKKNIYKVFICSAFNGFEKYFFIGTKEQLMTLIGVLYSTRLVKIERISYQKVFEVPEEMSEIKYIVQEDNTFSYISRRCHND